MRGDGIWGGRREKKGSELEVMTKGKNLSNYIFTVTEKSPKKFRFTLVSRMQNLSLDVIENLYYANSIYVRTSKENVKISQRNAYQKKAFVKLKLLSYIALMAREQQCILPKQYEQISIQAFETEQLLVAWARSDRNRYKKLG